MQVISDPFSFEDGNGLDPKGRRAQGIAFSHPLYATYSGQEPVGELWRKVGVAVCSIPLSLT
jgi:hypothetical protein